MLDKVRWKLFFEPVLRRNSIFCLPVSYSMSKAGQQLGHLVWLNEYRKRLSDNNTSFLGDKLDAWGIWLFMDCRRPRIGGNAAALPLNAIRTHLADISANKAANIPTVTGNHQQWTLHSTPNLYFDVIYDVWHGRQNCLLFGKIMIFDWQILSS